MVMQPGNNGNNGNNGNKKIVKESGNNGISISSSEVIITICMYVYRYHDIE